MTCVIALSQRHRAFDASPQRCRSGAGILPLRVQANKDVLCISVAKDFFSTERPFDQFPVSSDGRKWTLFVPRPPQSDRKNLTQRRLLRQDLTDHVINWCRLCERVVARRFFPQAAAAAGQPVSTTSSMAIETLRNAIA